MTCLSRKRSSLISICFIVVVSGYGGCVLMLQGQDASNSLSASSVPPSLTPFSTAQLDAMVAPIALYPDALVAQVLAAALYPDQIAFADDWLGQNGNLSGSALTQAVNQQPWDPSVKALTQFPTVLHNLARNLAWASNLGQAFENQQSDTMAAVQAMRAKAQAAGTLQSTSQIKVVHANPSTIVIQPANPQVVYVPQYNPDVVYGSPFLVPLYTPPPMATATVSFGAGVAIGAAFGGGFAGGGASWGFSSWNCSWGGGGSSGGGGAGGGGGGGNVVYNHNTYVNKTVINQNNNNYNYRPWGQGPQGPGPHPYGPNGNNPYMPGGNGYRPAGLGPNGNRGQIGGPGGTQHLVGGPGGTQHLIGGNGGVQHFPNGNGPAQQHPLMAGNGNQARAEANRGLGSMQQRAGAAQGGARDAAIRRR